MGPLPGLRTAGPYRGGGGRIGLPRRVPDRLRAGKAGRVLFWRNHASALPVGCSDCLTPSVGRSAALLS